MFAQINHIAIISHQYPLLEKYYQVLFGLKSALKSWDPAASPVVGDGRVGLNILPRRDGYVGGLDHFGLLVDSIDVVLKRMQKNHPRANIAKRPSTRPFAAYSGHDPDGNVFDLAPKGGDNLKDLYANTAEKDWHQDRHFNRFAIRTLNAKQVADFYAEVFELKPIKRKTEDPNIHLTDGHMTLSIMPWSIEGFAGMSIKRSGPDHFGMRVEDVEAFKNDVQKLGGQNTYLTSWTLGGSPESEVRRRYFERCALGKFQLADPDGNWIDVTDESWT